MSVLWINLNDQFILKYFHKISALIFVFLLIKLSVTNSTILIVGNEELCQFYYISDIHMPNEGQITSHHTIKTMVL